MLTEHPEPWPLTTGQAFYRAAGAHCYPKTEKSDKRLREHLNRARRVRALRRHQYGNQSSSGRERWILSTPSSSTTRKTVIPKAASDDVSCDEAHGADT